MNKEYEWRPEIGTRVTLLGTHPWADYSGVVERYDKWMGQPTMSVMLDNGISVGVIYSTQFIKGRGYE